VSLLQLVRDARRVCSCTDVRVQENEGLLVSAVLVHVKHVDTFSEDILYPYRKDEGSGVVFGEPTSEATQYRIFATPRELS
jgi:hypothetical protein